MGSAVTPEELFTRIEVLVGPDAPKAPALNRMMHDTLVLCCHEGVKDTGQNFGNLFSQVDYLCHRFRFPQADINAVQKARRDSNRQTELLPEDVLYDARALAQLVAAVFSTSVPDGLTRRLPHGPWPQAEHAKVNNRCLRCIVEEWDEDSITASIDDDAHTQVRIDLASTQWGADHHALTKLIKKGTQLNLIDNHVEQGRVESHYIVFEPDYLVDISSIAACFTDFGHHPLLYVLNLMKPRANTQATLLGNFAGSVLDDVINRGTDFNIADTIRGNFREKALEYSSCKIFEAKRFYKDAQTQASNIKKAVDSLFAPCGDTTGRGQSAHDRDKALLEPSFVCEALGLQGRVDLMTTDMQLLVEQKSGRNIYLERHSYNPRTHSVQLESHYVQLLLYFGVLHCNFGFNHSDVRLLYSKYEDGLVSEALLRSLFREALAFRNEVVATLFAIAREGFGQFLDLLNPDTLNTQNCKDFFFETYLRPQLAFLTSPLHAISPLERDYFCRAMTFVMREDVVGRIGIQEGVASASSDLWTMPLAEKKDTGNIYTDLELVKREKSTSFNGFDTLTLHVPDQGDDFLPNFRIGDMVYLYAYAQGDEPDVRRAILFKGVMASIASQEIVVHLADGQQNALVFDQPAKNLRGRAVVWAVEHSARGTSSDTRSLYQFITGPQSCRDLLLGQRPPRLDDTLNLSRSYDECLDPMLLRALRAQDYFLLVGPPGTGKTSRALQFMVREGLAHDHQLLLMAYTNRAVDEICEMLQDSGIDYLRLGNTFSCDERFRDHLLDQAVASEPRLDAVRNRIAETRVVVGTTSMLQARPFIFDIKHFHTAIIDEASQILEPHLVGLLSKVDKFILIGDYKQLPAVVQQGESDSEVPEPRLRAIGLNNLRNSLFERLIRWEESHHRTQFTGVLHRQGRMHPDIAAFPNQMFYFNEHLRPVPCAHQLEPSSSRRMMFIPSPRCASAELSDKVNPAEAEIVTRCLVDIYHREGASFDAHHTVGVIVPYRNQIAMVRREVEATGIEPLRQVSIDTVERYQGSQRDIIIYSFTVQHPYQLDFLTANTFEEDGHSIDRKLNVALTRARKQMIITGNPDILERVPLFQKLMTWCEGRRGAL